MPKLKQNISSKKQLKDYINQNGFFCGLEINEIKKDEVVSLSENSIKTKAKIPEGDNIRLYKGLATQRFGKGEVSRNDYKIDPEGWDWSNYLVNPAILYQHEDSKVFGQALEINAHDKGVDILFYVDLNALDDKEAYRVAQGFVKALSTGHITHEYMWEHTKTGERVTASEMQKRVYDDETEDKWNDFVFVVTKAEALEVSMVTLPSNPKALTVQNGIEIFYQNNISDMNISQKNSSELEQKNLKNESETPEGQKAESSETPAEEPKTDSVQIKEDKIENQAPVVEKDFLKIDQFTKILKENEIIQNLIKTVVRLDQVNQDLQRIVDNIPNQKKLINQSQFSEKKDQAGEITKHLLSFIK